MWPPGQLDQYIDFCSCSLDTGELCSRRERILWRNHFAKQYVLQREETDLILPSVGSFLYSTHEAVSTSIHGHETWLCDEKASQMYPVKVPGSLQTSSCTYNNLGTMRMTEINDKLSPESQREDHKHITS